MQTSRQDVGTTALFIGDSVTDYYRRTDADSPLGRGFVRRVAEMAQQADDGLRVINRGIAGNRVRDLRNRWAEDCLELAPDVLTILVGINDTWRRYDESDRTSSESFAADYAALLESASRLPNLTRLVLMEPFLAPVTDDQAVWHEEDLNAKIDVVRGLASRFRAELIPLDRIFAEACAVAGPEAVAADGVHPTEAGNELIAQAWWAAHVAHQGSGR